MGLDVKINPKPRDRCKGLKSYVSWDNRDVMRGLNLIFGTMPGEKIVGVEIDSSGITARFERVEVVKDGE